MYVYEVYVPKLLSILLLFAVGFVVWFPAKSYSDATKNCGIVI